MSLKRRFFLVLSTSFAIAIALSVFTIRTMNDVRLSYDQVANDTFPIILALEDLRYAALRIVSSTSEYGLITVVDESLMSDDDEGTQEAREEELIKYGSQVLDDVLLRASEFAEPGKPVDFETIAELEFLANDLKSTSSALKSAIDELSDFREINELKERLEEIEQAILDLTTTKIQLMRNDVEADHAMIGTTIDAAIQFIVANAVIFALLLFGVWMAISNSVVRPIRELNQATIAITEGKYDDLPELKSNDEVGSLAKAFSQMASNLQRLFSEKESALEVARQNERRFKDIADAASDWIWETDEHHCISFVSDRFSTLTGVEVQDVLGRSLDDLLLPEDKKNSLRSKLTDQKHLRDIRCRIVTRGGSMSICRVSGKPHFNASDRFTGFRGTVTDISEQVEAERKARHLALHDALTGLPNRTLLEERLRQSLSEGKRDGTSVAVIGLDLDRFKEVNDTLGHSAGDALLSTIAERMVSLTRDTDTVSRIGGDEFVIIQAGATQPQDAHIMCQRILESLGKPIDIGEHTVFPAASIGVALSPDDGTQPEELLKHADIAMYRSKRDGRGNFCFFKPGMNKEIQERKKTENDLRRAIDEDELSLCYQPPVDIGTNSVVGFEALVRWQHPERGLLSPDEFIPLAEDTGLVLSLGEWVLRHACEAAVEWPDQFVAVNLSPVQFRDQNLVENIARILTASQLSPTRLELEITESVLLADADYAFMVLDGLRELGVRIAMADFGTGYSSLSYLQRFHFDKIKLDRRFVDAVSNSDESRAIVRALLMLGRTLGMTTTAEGVETASHVEFLAAENCDQFQGFYFSEPIAADQINAFLNEIDKTGFNHALESSDLPDQDGQRRTAS